MYTLTLQSARMASPSTRHLAFARSDGQAVSFIPGQFITIHFEIDGKMLRRSYSVASIAGVEPTIDIAVSYVKDGPGTELLFHLQPGDEVQATGPFGRLILEEEIPQRYILMATGTGVTPYRSMLPLLAARIKSHGTQVIVLQGVKTRQDLLYAEDFIAAAELPGFTFYACYSREQAPLVDPQPFEHCGYVQDIFNKLEPNPEQDIVYLCGNPSMIDAAFAQCKALDFPMPHVRREKYISPN